MSEGTILMPIDVYETEYGSMIPIDKLIDYYRLCILQCTDPMAVSVLETLIGHFEELNKLDNDSRRI